MTADDRHDSPSGWFSKSRGLSASVFFLSSTPLPALLLAPFFARSLALVPRSLLLKRTETLATQARHFCTILVNQKVFQKSDLRKESQESVH